MNVVWRIMFTPIVLLTLLFTLGSSHPAQAQDGGGRYFSETGHWVDGDFLDFYQSYPNAAFLFGAPISSEFNDPLSGVRVQYFQRVRFEFRPENPPGERVTLTQLGSLLYEPGQPAAIGDSNPACETVAGNPFGEFQICYSFLDFFKKHGGVEQFGYPISDLEYHNERMMQYFEYARIDWYPELRPGLQITLANLGQIDFRQRSLNPQLLEPEYSLVDTPLLHLRPKAFLEKASVSAGEEQTLYVTVHDQNLQPVPGAEASYVVIFSDDTQLRGLMPPTDDYGISANSFPVSVSSRDVAEVIVTVTNGSLMEIIRTSFRVWW